MSGAGISAESGLKTFRGADGWWQDHRVEDLATPEAFERDPALVHRFYNMRRRLLLAPDVKPNAAHHALAEFEKAYTGLFTLVTQNVDDLHERAGSRSVLHMHGELLKKRCRHCDWVARVAGDMDVTDACGRCDEVGGLRPAVVWFGEVPYYLDEIAVLLGNCDLFLAVGTSGNVYPAAGFVQIANSVGAHTVEINLEPSAGSSMFKDHRYGPAGEVVPSFLREFA